MTDNPDNVDWRDGVRAAAPIYKASDDHKDAFEFDIWWTRNSDRNDADFAWWQGWTWDEAWRVTIFALPALYIGSRLVTAIAGS